MPEELEGTEDELAEEFDGKPRKKGKIIPILIAVVCLAAGSAVGAMGLGNTVGTVLADRAANADDGGSGGHGGGEASSLHVVDNLVVNPAASGGGRFLLTSIALETVTPEGAELLAARDIELRDVMIMVLGSKTVAELTDIRSRASLATELLAVVEKIVGDHVVSRLFIPQFVIQ